MLRTTMCFALATAATWAPSGSAVAADAAVPNTHGRVAVQLTDTRAGKGELCGDAQRVGDETPWHSINVRFGEPTPLTIGAATVVITVQPAEKGLYVARLGYSCERPVRPGSTDFIKTEVSRMLRQGQATRLLYTTYGYGDGGTVPPADNDYVTASLRVD